jgi:membrane-bound inhibitor of C-type lysozyme
MMNLSDVSCPANRKGKGQTIHWSKGKGQTIHWSNRKGQTIHWSKGKGQTIHWSKGKGQTIHIDSMLIFPFALFKPVLCKEFMNSNSPTTS